MMTLTAFFLRGLKQRLQWEILGKYQVQNPCLDCVSQISQFLPAAGLLAKYDFLQLELHARFERKSTKL